MFCLLKARGRYLLSVVLLLAVAPVQAQMQGEPDADLPAPARAQAPLHFEHLTVADGLNQGSVFAVHQDSRGFMWFGTQGGLNRYDGYTFTTYQNIPFDLNAHLAAVTVGDDVVAHREAEAGAFAGGLGRVFAVLEALFCKVELFKLPTVELPVLELPVVEF